MEINKCKVNMELDNNTVPQHKHQFQQINLQVVELELNFGELNIKN